MGMRVLTAQVRDGRIVLDDGVTLPEGAQVVVIVGHDSETFEATTEEESELLEAIAEVEQGETVRAVDLLERLRR